MSLFQKWMSPNIKIDVACLEIQCRTPKKKNLFIENSWRPLGIYIRCCYFPSQVSFSPLFDLNMSTQFFYEDGRGNVVDENGRPELMDYIVDQEQFALETISSHTQYLLTMPFEKSSRAKTMQIDRSKDEDSHMREVTERRAYTSYTPQDKARFFKLKIEKCISASAAAKQLGIHVRTAQRWVKQYEKHPDSIFESGKKKGRRRILTEEHKDDHRFY